MIITDNFGVIVSFILYLFEGKINSFIIYNDETTFIFYFINFISFFKNYLVFVKLQVKTVRILM